MPANSQSESDHHNEVRASVSTAVCLGLSHDSLGFSHLSGAAQK